MKLKVLKYNKNEARKKFVLFKLVELFGLFLFTFGFETFGRFIYGKVGYLMDVPIPVTYFDFWFFGFMSLILIFMYLVLVSFIGYGIFLLVKVWIKANWRWAKEAAEDEDSKIERLSEQKKLKDIKKIEKQEKDRKEYGFCVEDTAIRIKSGNWGRIGHKFEVRYINNKKNFDGESKKHGRCNYLYNKKFKFIKKKLPKKPKLNKIREKEVKDRKKK